MKIKSREIDLSRIEGLLRKNGYELLLDIGDHITYIDYKEMETEEGFFSEDSES